MLASPWPLDKADLRLNLTGACKKKHEGAFELELAFQPSKHRIQAVFERLGPIPDDLDHIPKLRFFDVSNRALSAFFFENPIKKTRNWAWEIRIRALGHSISESGTFNLER